MHKIVFFLVIFIPLYAFNFTLKNQELYKTLKQYDQEFKISQTKEWRNLTGWEENIFSFYSNNQDNRIFASKKKIYSPQEDFIDFAMSYIDPQTSSIEESIKCRTPKKYAFMKQLFSPFVSKLEQKNIICTPIDSGFLNDLEFIDPLSGGVIDFGPINAQSVTGFELLYAMPGTSDISEIAGHLLLRIKINNNPLAQELGIENPKDLVISFLANTKKKKHKPLKIRKKCTKSWFELLDTNNEDFDFFDSIAQPLKGLSGYFLTTMDIQTLGQTIKHYTIEENRTLLRFKLNLSHQQKKDLLEHLYNVKKTIKHNIIFLHKIVPLCWLK